MPTAAKLVAAVLLAVLAYILSELVRPLMPEGTAFGNFNYVNMAIGALTGWFIMGRRSGRGLVHGINNGLTGTAVMMLWALGWHAAYEMFRQAMRNRFDGPMEALTEIFLIASDNAVTIATVSVLGTAVIGAVIAGVLTDFAAKTWR
ncbi:TrgA family protein [Sulfitobacter sp. S190]|uniref:TrgA family protein n=1 Tax=Sulfitobacter sp. S190 TaxID=2867022 RepID=UPI0021A44CDC|nr:TrgA family protein [Sulfitobacter sp. S190]UWR23896.1 TrgA family protein [Sulfitobacter sp. S190]